MIIKEITEKYRDAVNQFLRDEWNCPPMVTKGRAIDTTVLPGYVSLDGERINGFVTYNIEDNECEIVALNSFDENKGIGTALINSVLETARESGCSRLWLITTNDNVGAIRFYQKKGFDWMGIYFDSLDVSREINPGIPLIGMDGIPVRHELEFEIRL